MTLSQFATSRRRFEDLGYEHHVIYDHVLGAIPAALAEDLLCTHRDAIHEPFVTLSHLAGRTKRIRSATAILVLPQRQTALVAPSRNVRTPQRAGVEKSWS